MSCACSIENLLMIQLSCITLPITAYVLPFYWWISKSEEVEVLHMLIFMCDCVLFAIVIF